MGKGFSFRRRIFSFFHRRGGRKKGESEAWDALYRALSYRFRDETLLREAFTHRSSLYNGTKREISNERLEFLGDAVLGIIVTDELYQQFPSWSEGRLSKAKSYLVSREMLAQQAKKIGLGDYLFLGSGEERSGGRGRKSILSDAYEALLGAMYLDGGLDKVRRFMRQHLLKEVDRITRSKFYKNYKSWLLEYFQGEEGKRPEYRILEETGPDHKKEFTVEVCIDGRVLGKGRGSSKKSAEQEAARRAVERLGLHV